MSENSLKNHFLISSPQMIDPLFDKSVIYIYEHDTNGAKGLIINKSIEKIRFNQIIYLKKEILNDLKKEESTLIYQIKDLDFKNSLLSDNLDLDYIETLIRERFLFGKKNETIYIIKNNDTKN